MNQLGKNKMELLEMMNQLGKAPLTGASISNLCTLRSAYKALDMLCEEDMEPEDYVEDYHSLTREAALEWTSRMKNEDGTTGAHWTIEQTEQARKQRNIVCDPLAFYVAMNMIYSDYCKAAEKVNANSLDFYAYMAKAFLDDKDAQPDKLERYYNFIAKE